MTEHQKMRRALRRFVEGLFDARRFMSEGTSLRTKLDLLDAP